MNQYKVVMEVDPRYTQDISALEKMFVINNEGKAIPLSYFAKWQPANAPLSVNHQGLSAASTISFNLPTGKSLSDASAAIDRAMTQLGVPSTVRGSFAGTAQVFPGDPDYRRHRHGVYRAGYPLRELRTSADDSLHPALGGRWSAVGAGAVQCPVQPNRPDRDHAINRHREEKRHYDGRFCA